MQIIDLIKSTVNIKKLHEAESFVHLLYCCNAARTLKSDMIMLRYQCNAINVKSSPFAEDHSWHFSTTNLFHVLVSSGSAARIYDLGTGLRSALNP